jgi:hypothetical protein
VLVEPTSVVAKAWEHLTAVAGRALWQPRRAPVTGAPIGLLAALLGVQRELDIHVLDRVQDGPKPDLVRDLGATYHTGRVADVSIDADLIIEAIGPAQVVFDAMELLPRDGVLCLTGLTPAGRRLGLDASALNRELVLENNVVIGSVNANRRHYDRPAGRLPPPTPTGSPGSSPVRCRSRPPRTPCTARRTTSRRSSSSGPAERQDQRRRTALPWRVRGFAKPGDVRCIR